MCFNIITLFVQCIVFSFKGSYLLGKREKNERSTKKTMQVAVLVTPPPPSSEVPHPGGRWG